MLEVEAGAPGEGRHPLLDLLLVGHRDGGGVEAPVQDAVVDAVGAREGEHPGGEAAGGHVPRLVHDGVERVLDLGTMEAVRKPEDAVLPLPVVL